MVFSVGLLTAWYGAQASQSLALSASRNAAPSPSSSAAAQRNNDVLPPWDPRGEIVALDALRRDVLADGQFFDSTLRNFSSLDVSEDEKTLFALHQGFENCRRSPRPPRKKAPAAPMSASGRGASMRALISSTPSSKPCRWKAFRW
jgi:hypothetical protein